MCGNHEQTELKSDDEENSKQQKYTIFISHKLVEEDKLLAITIKDKLKILGNDRLDIFSSEDIAAGEKWREEIERKIKNSDILLFLFTKEEAGWEWCLFEAGIFLGSEGERKKHLICFKNFEIKDLISPLGHLQFFDSTSDGVKNFLNHLLEKGTYTENQIINSKTQGEDKQEFENAYRDISTQFAATSFSRDFLPKRLQIGPLKKSDDGRTRVLKDTTVKASNEAQDILPIDFSSDVYWEDLKEAICVEDDGACWVGDIENIVNILQTKKGRPPNLLKPYRATSGVMHYPVLTRIEHIKREPINLYISFIEKNEESDAPLRNMHIKREPKNQNKLLSLLERARFFRWDILEWAMVEFKDGHITDGQKDVIYEKFETILTQLERDSKEENLLSCDYVAAYFDGEFKNQICELYASYDANRRELKKVLETRDDKVLVEFLKNWRLLNKKFMILTINQYLSQINMLEPQGLLLEAAS